MSISLKAHALAKQYYRRMIFQGIDLQAKDGDILAITGHNGAGKSTLIKILAGVLPATAGSVVMRVGEHDVSEEQRPSHVGFVAPYLVLYEEFNALELMRLMAGLRGIAFDAVLAGELLDRFGLGRRARREAISGYSSGMKQRMKYVLALQHRPPLLLLDEPMSNLDGEGIGAVRFIIKNHADGGGAVLLATNDERDLELCHSSVAVAPSVQNKRIP